jgi:hypothetical protein
MSAEMPLGHLTGALRHNRSAQSLIFEVLSYTIGGFVVALMDQE